MQAKGWAVIEYGEINVRSISPTRRAAIVNWLCTEASAVLSNAATDIEIEELWATKRGTAVVGKVMISRVV